MTERDRWVPESVHNPRRRADGTETTVIVIPEDDVDATLRAAVYYERDDRRFRVIGCGFEPISDIAGMCEVIVKGGAGTAGALMRMLRDKIAEEYGHDRGMI